METRIVLTADPDGRLCSVTAEPLYVPFGTNQIEHVVYILEQALKAVRGETLEHKGETCVPEVVESSVRGIRMARASLN